MTEVVFEPLHWWHLPQVLELEEELFAPECWTEELFWSELAQGENRWYVVGFDGDRLLAYGGLALGGDDAYVQTIGVAQAAQGRGLGAKLLEAMLDVAAASDAHRVALEVRADNDVAQRLYARHDFEAVGRRRGYYQPSGMDAVIMIRELS
jgi:ribosomal-protein-alanine N-acetyltransferase